MDGKMIRVVLGAVLSIVFIGCSARTELEVKEVQRSGMDAVIMDNSAKVTYIKEHGHVERFCASRESDVQKTSSQGLALGFSAANQGESIGEGSTSGALSLGGRSPAVLISRELMYRACELTMNLNTDTKTSVEVYKMFLDSISNIVKNEHDTGSKSTAAMPVSATQLQLRGEEKEVVNIDDDEDEDY